MLNLRETVNRHFAQTEPWKLIAGSGGTVALVFGIVRVLLRWRGAEQLVNKEKGKILASMHKELEKPVAEFEKFAVLPPKGLPRERVLQLMTTMKSREEPKWKTGHVSGGIYVMDDAHVEFLNKAYALYSVSNPLHPDVWPSVRKFEAEVIRITAGILSGDENVCGAMTSGGTESILMALKTYRDAARAANPSLTVPEIVAPVTAHAAFDKGCQYFGMKLVNVPLGADMRVDINAMRRAITPNTILLVGSACNFPHGVIDSIMDIASLAMQHNLGLHVDCCLGGYVLPFMKRLGHAIPDFDFRIPAVTSISIDTHKYGMTPKGSSVILFRSAELRRFMYFAATEWPGGLYASPTMAGSRPGAIIAAAWAAILSVGDDGYMQQAALIGAAVTKLKNAIRQNPHLALVGDPEGPVVAWTSPSFDVYRLIDAMHKPGWSLNALHKPNSVHFCVTPCNVRSVEQLIADLNVAAEECSKLPPSKEEKMAPIYGMGANMFDRGLVRDIMTGYLDALTQS